MRFPGLFTGMKNLLWVRGLVGFAGVGWLAGVAGGVPELTPLPLASSGDSSGLVGANALLPPPPGGLTAGQMVEFIPCP